MADVRSAPRPPRFSRPAPLSTSNSGDSLLPSTTGRSTPSKAASPFSTPPSRRPSSKLSPKLCSATASNSPVNPPTVADLGKALILLDTDKDGKIWEADLDTVVNIAFGARVSSASGEANDVSIQWAEMKEPFVRIDGFVKLAPFIAALKSGDSFGQLSRLAEQAPKVEGCLGPFKGVLQYVAMFDMFDTDKNGVICAKDLQKALAKVKGREVPIEEARNQIEIVEGSKNVVDLARFGALAAMLLGRSNSSKGMMVVSEEDEDGCCIAE